MTDRRPLVVVAGQTSDMPSGDNLPLSTMPVTLQALINDVLTSSSGAPLMTSAGDFITTSAA